MGRRPKVLILHVTGSNRDRAAARACTLAGGEPDVVLVNRVLDGTVRLRDYQMLLLPGGFSYGDDLGAGKLWALRLRSRLGEELAAFVDADRPVLGICNGFQALVKSGLLPGPLAPRSDDAVDDTADDTRTAGDADSQDVFGPAHATLTRNASAKFECRWVHLAPNPKNNSVFTRDLGERLVHCPVAHGEGRFVARDAATLTAIEANNLVALRYVDPAATDTGVVPYPANPNGSQHHIAGLSNRRGTILGLMPHPEDHINPLQHPTRGVHGQLGLALFEAGIRYAAGL